MDAEPAGAVDATTESDATSEATEQSSVESPTTSFEAALLKAAAEDGHTLGKADLPEATAEPDIEPEQLEAEHAKALKELGEPELPELPETPPEGKDVEEKAEPEVKHGTIAEQVAAYKARGEKPPWELVRILEESTKRRHDREVVIPGLQTRAEAAEAKAAQLEAQLASTSAPPPTADNPFADVYDPAQLTKFEDTYEKILEFSEKNRDGAENVLVGREPNGTEIRKDLTAEEVADMRYKADRALRKDIPQRRALLAERAKADAVALEIYPELQDSQSDMTKEAIAILKANRQLETVLGPEALIWIGHAIKGRNAYLSQNGKTTATRSDAATRIETAARTKIAPTPTKSRSGIERKGSDLAALNKKFEKRGDKEAAEELVGALLQKRGTTAKKLEPIA